MALIKVVESRGSADILACAVQSDHTADLLVYVVKNKAAAIGDAFWCFVKSSPEATSKVCFVDSPSGAHLLVHFVQSRVDAGWRTKLHPLEGTL
ncbi:MAG: DUF6150 family protein [Anaerolineae bacterium]|jgi:hypothetical protein